MIAYSNSIITEKCRFHTKYVTEVYEAFESILFNVIESEQALAIQKVRS